MIAHDAMWRQIKRVSVTKFGITLGDWDRQNMLNDPIVKAFYDQIENESCVREWLSKRDSFNSINNH